MFKNICLNWNYISQVDLWCKLVILKLIDLLTKKIVDNRVHENTCVTWNIRFSHFWSSNFLWKWHWRFVVTRKNSSLQREKDDFDLYLFLLVILSTRTHSTNEILEFVDKSFSFLSSTVSPCVLLTQIVELNFPELLDWTLMKMIIGYKTRALYITSFVKNNKFLASVFVIFLT